MHRDRQNNRQTNYQAQYSTGMATWQSDPYDVANRAWAGPQDPYNCFYDADVGYPLCSAERQDDPNTIVVYDSTNPDAWIQADSQTVTPRTNPSEI